MAVRVIPQTSVLDSSQSPVGFTSAVETIPLVHAAVETASMSFVTSGWATVEFEHGVVHARRGTVLTIPPGLPSRLEPVGYTEAVTLQMLPSFLASQLQWLPTAHPLSHQLHAATTSRRIEALELGDNVLRWLAPRLFNLAQAEVAARRPLAVLAAVATLFDDIDRLSGLTDRGSARDPIPGGAGTPRPEVVKAATLLREHITHRWTIRELSRCVALSEAQLTRLFRTDLDVSPAAYLWHARTDHMAQLLAAGSVTISEAASRAGWLSASAASRAFRRRYGVNPRRFATDLHKFGARDLDYTR